MDIPSAWRNTTDARDRRPRFWDRTGCRYDRDEGIAPCETGDCAGHHNCSPAGVAGPAPVTSVEFCFKCDKNFNYWSASATDGTTVSVTIQPLGPHSPHNPRSPGDSSWCASSSAGGTCDARIFRVTFAPGGSGVPVTASGSILLCPALPATYGYADAHRVCSGASSSEFAGARLSPRPWDCAVGHLGHGTFVPTSGVLCRWNPLPPAPTCHGLPATIYVRNGRIVGGPDHFDYYHQARTHLALDKDEPDLRPIELPAAGKIVEVPEVGGLHHRCLRQAA